jgi:hypothetical protein
LPGNRNKTGEFYMKTCHNCSTEYTGVKPSVRETCKKCLEYLHCCANCGCFDTYSSGQCTADVLESPNNKTSFNFCDYFMFRKMGENKTNSSDTRKNFDQLFGK